jgi:hypothetical protein
MAMRIAQALRMLDKCAVIARFGHCWQCGDALAVRSVSSLRTAFGIDHIFVTTPDIFPSNAECRSWFFAKKATQHITSLAAVIAGNQGHAKLVFLRALEGASSILPGEMGSYYLVMRVS